MPQMSKSEIRVQDPILTTIVQGHVQQEYVGSHLFPEVQVPKRSSFVIRFDKDNFALFDVRRTPGAPMKRRSVRYSNEQVSLYQDAIEGELPVEDLEESEDLPLDLQEETAMAAKETIDLRLEYDQAQIATDYNNYDSDHRVTPSSTEKWSYRPADPDTDPEPADPVLQVNEWKEAVRRSVGVYPNRAVIGPHVYNWLDRMPAVREQFKYTSDNSLTTDMIARLFNLPGGVKVGASVVMNPETGELEDIWGCDMVLAYVPPVITTRKVPSYGYTYNLRGYPVAESGYYVRQNRSWYFPVIAERKPYITAMKAGFLVKDLVVPYV